jgi:hypothetical protein
MPNISFLLLYRVATSSWVARTGKKQETERRENKPLGSFRNPISLSFSWAEQPPCRFHPGPHLWSFGSSLPRARSTLSASFSPGDRTPPLGSGRLHPISSPRDSPTPRLSATRRRSSLRHATARPRDAPSPDASPILPVAASPQVTSVAVPDPRHPDAALPSPSGEETPSPPHCPTSIQTSPSYLRPSGVVLPPSKRHNT